jgi:hypothetical protein
MIQVKGHLVAMPQVGDPGNKVRLHVYIVNSATTTTIIITIIIMLYFNKIHKILLADTEVKVTLPHYLNFTP